MPFKRVITGKKQPGGPGRSSDMRGGSSRSLEEVAELETDVTPAKQRKKEPATKGTGKGGRGKGGRGKKK